MVKPLLCVCDLDETLLGSDKRISDENLKAALYAKESGVLFTVATGRSHLQIREFVANLKIEIPIITCNGGTISVPGSEEILTASYLDANRAKEICAYCEENNLDYLMYTAKNICYTRESQRILSYVRYNAGDVRNEYRVPLKCMDDVCDPDFKEAIKILVLGDNSRLLHIRENFNKDDKLTIVSSGVGLVDIMTRNISKGNAIKFLAERFDIPLSRVAVFGDSPNDDSMFEVAGIKIAMANATEKLKQMATFVTKTNNENGVAHALLNIIRT